MDLYIFILYLTIIGIISIKKQLSQRLFKLNCLLALLFISLRSYDVGSVDTINYVNWCMDKGDSVYERDEDIIEPGYVLYIHILKFFVPYGTVYLMINTALALLPLFYIIIKKSENPHLSLMLLFMPLTIMHRFYFVCQRQIAAMGIVLIAIILYEKINKKRQRFIMYVLLSFVAYNLQHFSILPAILFLLLSIIQVSKRLFVILSIGSLGVGIFLGGIQDFAFLTDIFLQTEGSFHQLLRYSDAELHSGAANYMQSVTSTLLGLFYVKFSDNKVYDSIYSKMYLAGILILNTLISVVEVYRVAAMFIIFGIVILPCVMKNRNQIVHDKLLFFTMLLSVLYCYYSYFWSLYSIYIGEAPIGNDSLVPFEYFWQDKYNY